MVQKSNIYFINQYKNLHYNHGGIGLADAEKIWADMGAEEIIFPCQFNTGWYAKIKRIRFVQKMYKQIKVGDIVLLIYPVYAQLVKKLVRLLVKKGVTVICLIGDIDGIKDGDAVGLQQDINFLQQFKYFIVHNSNMKEWAVTHLKAAPENMTAIDFFDFLIPALPEPVGMVPGYNIVFAGNLAKSGFLNQWNNIQEGNPELKLVLYGPGADAFVLQQPGVIWEGVYEPPEMPFTINGHFGLLWDGEGIDSPSGSLGNYMQYISHHKLSLYVLARLPVIVPEHTAAQAIVEKYGIGIAVKSLHQLQTVIDNTYTPTYLQMQQNMQVLATHIATGERLRVATQYLLKKLS